MSSQTKKGRAVVIVTLLLAIAALTSIPIAFREDFRRYWSVWQLTSEDSGTRRAAAEFLHEIGALSSIPRIVRAECHFRDLLDFVVGFAANDREAVVRGLGAVLHSATEETEVRCYAAQLLAVIGVGSDRTTQHLSQAENSAAPAVKNCAREAQKKLQDSRQPSTLGLVIADRGGHLAIQDLLSGGMAQRLRFRRGDVLREFTGQEVTSLAALAGIVRDAQPGDIFDVVIERDGERLEKKLLVGRR